MTDLQLVAQLVDGSEPAWEEFIRRFQRRIYSVFVSQFRFSSDDVDDAFQQVMFRLCTTNYRALKAWKANAALAGYIQVIACRVALDRVKPRRRVEE